MKIAMLVRRFPVATETFIARQARGLDATVLTLRIDESVPMPAWARVCQLPQPERHPPRAIRGMRAAWRLATQHNRYGLSAIAGRALVERLRELGPAVVLAQYGPVGLGALSSCVHAGVPLVVHFHGHDLSAMYRRRSYRYSLQGLARRAAGAIVVNEVMRLRLVAQGFAPERIALIPCGVPVSDFAPSDRPFDGPCRFLAVGRMVPKKAPLDLIRAFSVCAETDSDATLTMVGPGPLEEQARRFVQDLGLSDRVQLLGVQPHARVRELMSEADVFVQHSVTAPDGDEEGWPVAIAEACASALPVVSTRHAGIIDQVIEGESGYLVNEGDWEAMGARMLELADQPELRRSMGAVARRHIEETGDLAHQVDKLWAFLGRCVRNR